MKITLNIIIGSHFIHCTLKKKKKETNLHQILENTRLIRKYQKASPSVINIVMWKYQKASPSVINIDKEISIGMDVDDYFLEIN